MEHDTIKAFPADEKVVDIAGFFKVFGDPTRLKILFLLEGGELPVNAIVDALGMQQSADRKSVV